VNDASSTQQATDRVLLRLPATSAYLSVLRTTTAALASRLDFTLDAIEDLRIAVDEACALLLPHAVPEATMDCLFELTGAGLHVRVTVPTAERPTLDRESFAWTVLTALVDSVTSSTDDGEVTLSMVRGRDAREGPP
jgi:serine/threonine-protein kinase RsbW